MNSQRKNLFRAKSQTARHPATELRAPLSSHGLLLSSWFMIAVGVVALVTHVVHCEGGRGSIANNVRQSVRPAFIGRYVLQMR